MNRIRWNHIYCKFVILFLLVLVAYLLVSNTKNHQPISQDFIANLKSNKWIQTLLNSNQFNCIKCDKSSEYNFLNEIYELDYKRLSRFDAIPFKTVEDAWSPNKRTLAPYIKAGRMTAILYPNFQVKIVLFP